MRRAMGSGTVKYYSLSEKYDYDQWYISSSCLNLTRIWQSGKRSQIASDDRKELLIIEERGGQEEEIGERKTDWGLDRCAFLSTGKKAVGWAHAAK